MASMSFHNVRKHHRFTEVLHGASVGNRRSIRPVASLAPSSHTITGRP
jgi:hypothetical protein